MGSDSEVDKERNMDSHRRREKDRQGGSERKGRRAALERGDKGALGKRKGAGNAARSIEEWDLRDVATSRSVCFNTAVLISPKFCCFSYQINQRQRGSQN